MEILGPGCEVLKKKVYRKLAWCLVRLARLSCIGITIWKPCIRKDVATNAYANILDRSVWRDTGVGSLLEISSRGIVSVGDGPRNWNEQV